MISTLTPKLFKSSPKTFCSYTNKTPQLQIIQIVNIPGWFFERVVFPKQRLVFEAPIEAEVEVYSSQSGHGFLMEKIPAIHLQLGSIT